jgi:hypothetical protein
MRVAISSPLVSVSRVDEGMSAAERHRQGGGAAGARAIPVRGSGRASRPIDLHDEAPEEVRPDDAREANFVEASRQGIDFSGTTIAESPARAMGRRRRGNRARSRRRVAG